MNSFAANCTAGAPPAHLPCQTQNPPLGHVKIVLPWRAKKSQHPLASSSLGASREFHLTLFPQGPIATGARRVSEHRCNVGRYPTFLLTERWNCWHASTRAKSVGRLSPGARPT